MIRRSPCELYIKYLAVHPDGFTDDGIRDCVRSQQLDYLGHEYTKRLREKMRAPVPFYPNNHLHQPSKKLLLLHKILGFFHPDEDALAAHQLLQKPRAKELIETMEIAGESHALIAHRLRGVGVTVTIRAVKRYCNFYWNLSLVDSTELRALLRIRIEHPRYRDDGQEPLPEQRLQMFAMNKVQYKDPRRMMVDVPITQMAGLMNQMRMGLMPSQVELAKLANATRVAATVRALETVMDGGPTGAASARDYTVVAKTMTEMITDLGSPDLELQKDLQQLALSTDDVTIPYIGELEGTHTVELEPQVIEAEAEVK